MFCIIILPINICIAVLFSFFTENTLTNHNLEDYHNLAFALQFFVFQYIFTHKTVRFYNLNYLSDF